MLHTLLLSVLTLAILFSSLWAVLALWYRLPLLSMAWVAALLPLFYLLWAGQLWMVLPAYGLCYLSLLLWWRRLKPSNERHWTDDLARTTTGSIEGDRATLFNVRNFNWRSKTDYDVRWESREYDLSKLQSVDMITSYWDYRAIAHVLVSFGFEDGEHVVFSVEVRKERHQDYSEIGGFFKQFELSIVATDERDAVRVRTNVRDEQAYLYRITLNQLDGAGLFRAFVEEANSLAQCPRFYHTISANCTTEVFHMMRRIIPGLPLDYRLLLSGYLPDYVQKVGGLQPGFSAEELRRRGRFTERALAADQAEDFSRQIRCGVPGWERE